MQHIPESRPLSDEQIFDWDLLDVQELAETLTNLPSEGSGWTGDPDFDAADDDPLTDPEILVGGLSWGTGPKRLVVTGPRETQKSMEAHSECSRAIGEETGKKITCK